MVLLPGLSLAEENVYVQSLYTRLLSEPSLSSETIIKLDHGTKLFVIRKLDNWLRVASGNKIGWVYSFSITDQPPVIHKSLRAFQKKRKQNTIKARHDPSSVPTTAVIRGLDEPENSDGQASKDEQLQDQ